MNIVNQASAVYNPRYSEWVEKTKAKDLSGLTFEESSVIEEVKNLISQLGDSGIKVQITESQAQSNGMSIAMTGFVGTGVQGTGDFSLDLTTLKKMATDETFKQEMLATIQGYVDEEKENQRQFSSLKQSLPVQAPTFYMDFWNEDESTNKSANRNFYSQSLQSVIKQYEMQFNFIE